MHTPQGTRQQTPKVSLLLSPRDYPSVGTVRPSKAVKDSGTLNHVMHTGDGGGDVAVVASARFSHHFVGVGPDRDVSE